MIEESVRAALTNGDADAAVRTLWDLLASADDKPRAIAAIVQACWDANRLSDMLPLLDQSVAGLPLNAALRLTRGLVLIAVDRPEHALEDFRIVLRDSPASPPALCGMGSALIRLDRLTEARDMLERAKSLSPDDMSIQLNLAHVCLALGDYAAGWTYYESRLANPHPSRVLPIVEAPRWAGDADLTGRTILLQREQGYGDTIQFCRYAPALAAKGCKVRLAAPKPLVRLLRTLPAVDIVEVGTEIGPIDYYSPLMSLPLALGNIPSRGPYLRADSSSVASWHKRLILAAPTPDSRWSLGIGVKS